MTTATTSRLTLDPEHQENPMSATTIRPRALRRILLIAAVAGGAHLGGVSTAAPAFSAGDVCDLCSINFDLLACEESGGEPYDSNPGGSQGTPTVPTTKPTTKPTAKPTAKPAPKPVATTAPKATPKPAATTAPKPAATTAPRSSTPTKPKATSGPKTSSKPTSKPRATQAPRTGGSQATGTAQPTGTAPGTVPTVTQPPADAAKGTTVDEQAEPPVAEGPLVDELPPVAATGSDLTSPSPLAPADVTVVGAADGGAVPASAEDATATAAAQDAAAARGAGLGLLGALAATGAALLGVHAVRGRRATS
ncbi:hypothetical protein HF995_02755 [Sanguibacter hominis ATCC BAA-789]|uniref:Tat pathway signal sequence domain protein n=1 Tax=Sanguibacter hominis ATCC BAA-789 TaxID=1312740 RepID=A0A9X5F9X6_9MICO|nr:hypothetical protein [Sanguibacter hominis]NKX92200.1 hypothetical protein [Sanguibacter hominis ATCC BAA-789]